VRVAGDVEVRQMGTLWHENKKRYFNWNSHASCNINNLILLSVADPVEGQRETH
jgi:hypothetical protein